MGQRSQRRTAARATNRAGAGPRDGAEVPVVGLREPCPCGSGRRYKACHGRGGADAAVALVARPFEGLAGECDWVALREIVPAATAPLAVPAAGERRVTLATVLPLAWPALVRRDGEILLGLQSGGPGSGDVSRDLAVALEQALVAEPGSPVQPVGLPGPGPRLQDLLDPGAGLEVTLHPGFDFWVDDVEDAGPDVRASMERANAAVVPTVRLSSVQGAYWCRIGEREHLRWVLPYEEDALLDAMARLHAARSGAMGAGSRYVGSFRAHGLLVPVWDLAPGTEAAAVEGPAAEYAERLDAALAEGTPLTGEQRRARSALQGRQLTLR